MTDIINKWLQTSSAERFFQLEKQSFQTVADPLCGQMGIQLSLSQKNNYLKDLNVSSQYQLKQSTCILDNEPEVKRSLEPISSEKLIPSAIADLDALPFDNNQFTVVIVPQMNLFSTDPHAALREIYRVTASDGLIAISGVNKLSMIALQAKLMPNKFPLLPTVGLGQMKVWLSLLGCDIVRGNLFHYSAMQNHSNYPKISDKTEKIGNRWFPMFAGGYWLIAKKRIFGQIIREPRKLKRYKAGKISGQVANKL